MENGEWKTMNLLQMKIHDLFSPVLSDREIIKRMKKGQLITKSHMVQPHQIQPNSVDLTLGPTVRLIRPNAHFSACQVIDPSKEQMYEPGSFEYIDGKVSHDLNSKRPCYILDPGQFALMASREILDIPNGIISFVQGRSSIARLAIQTEQAGLIDAGFHATITFEVYNQSHWPVMLYEGMRVAQVYFFKAQYAEALYGKEKMSKYYGQVEATGSRVNKDREFYDVGDY